MKRFLLLTLNFIAAFSLMAQPPARLKEQVQKANQISSQRTVQGNVLTHSVREFPVQTAMPHNVTWRRDVYRILDLNKDANAPLYYPSEPQGNRMSLFTYMFKLMLRGQLKAYTYQLSGNEDFSPQSLAKVKELMDSHHIYYEQKDGRIKVNDADLPSAAVKYYFIKEASYYNASTATFHTQVEALCPVLVQQDDFGGAPVKYPLFWIKYADIAPQLARLTMMVSNLNNAAIMSANDYFAMNRYQGDIYKTNNMQGTVLTDMSTTNEKDSTSLIVRRKIEKELQSVQKYVWGDDSTKGDSHNVLTDSLSNLKESSKENKPTKIRMQRNRRTRVSTSKEKTVTEVSSSSITPRVTVRRQRR